MGQDPRQTWQFCPSKSRGFDSGTPKSQNQWAWGWHPTGATGPGADAPPQSNHDVHGVPLLPAVTLVSMTF